MHIANAQTLSKMHALYLSIKIISLTENEENWLDITSWIIWAHGTFANLLGVLLYPHGKTSLSAAAAAVAPSLLEALFSSKSSKWNKIQWQVTTEPQYWYIYTSHDITGTHPNSYFKRQRYNTVWTC